MLTLLKALAAIVACIFGILAIRAAAAEKKTGLVPSARLSIVGLIISLVTTLSLQLIESDAGKKRAFESKHQGEMLSRIADDTSRIVEPIDHFAVQYSVTYPLNTPAMVPLRKRLDSFIRQHFADAALMSDAYSDKTSKAGEDSDEPVEFEIKPAAIKSVRWPWSLFHGQLIIVNLYNRTIPPTSIRRGSFAADDDTFKRDETPQGDIQFKIPVFGDAVSDHCRMIYNTRAQKLRIIRSSYLVDGTDSWTTNRITNLQDLLGSHMLVRIKLEDMEHLVPDDFMFPGTTLDQAEKTYEFIDQEPELDYIAITAAKRTFLYRGPEFDKKKTYGSGPRYLIAWPETKEKLNSRQVELD